MSIHRYAARVDGNQAAIVDAFRAAGASVWPIRLPVDLLIGHGGKTALVEIKQLTGKKAPKAKPHTQMQKSFLLDWQGGTVATITDVQGALALLALMKGES